MYGLRPGTGAGAFADLRALFLAGWGCSSALSSSAGAALFCPWGLLATGAAGAGVGVSVTRAATGKADRIGEAAGTGVVVATAVDVEVGVEETLGLGVAGASGMAGTTWVVTNLNSEPTAGVEPPF